MTRNQNMQITLYSLLSFFLFVFLNFKILLSITRSKKHFLFLSIITSSLIISLLAITMAITTSSEKLKLMQQRNHSWNFIECGILHLYGKNALVTAKDSLPFFLDFNYFNLWHFESKRERCCNLWRCVHMGHLLRKLNA